MHLMQREKTYSILYLLLLHSVILQISMKWVVEKKEAYPTLLCGTAGKIMYERALEDIPLVKVDDSGVGMLRQICQLFCFVNIFSDVLEADLC